MRITDVTEAGTGTSMKARHWIDPATLDMLAQKRAYEKDLAKVKVSQPVDTTVKKSSPVKMIEIGSRNFRRDDVEHWIATKDMNWALGRSKKLFLGHLPEQLVDEISKDPVYQKIINVFWSNAALIIKNPAKAGESPIKFKDLPGRRQAFEIFNYLESYINKYRNKYGIDKTGRQLPKINTSLRDDVNETDVWDKPNPVKKHKKLSTIDKAAAKR